MRQSRARTPSAKENRRAEILAATRQVLAQKGVEDTTIAEIVAQAGCSQGTFYVYFPSKVAVIFALTREMLERVLLAVSAALSSASSFAEATSSGVTAAFDAMAGYADVLAIVNHSAAIAKHPAECERLRVPYYDLIALWVRHWQAAGQINARCDAPIAARFIVSLVEHAVEDCYLYHPEVAAERYKAEAADFIFQALASSAERARQS